jgi:hypothetical protein
MLIAAANADSGPGDEIGLGGKVAIHRAGSDAGALGDRRDLHRRHAALGRGIARRRENRIVTGGKLARDIVGLPIGHDESSLRKEVKHDSHQFANRSATAAMAASDRDNLTAEKPA